MDIISVIVPCYNQADFLPRCLESLIRQTYENLEIVCVNDASTDATMSVLDEYTKKDKRIKIVDIPHGGLGWARNCGIKAAMGKYLMFCDSDDEFMPDACEKLYHSLVDHNCDLALSSIKVIYDSDFHMKQSDDAYYNVKFNGVIDDSGNILNKVDVSVCNKIFKKSLIDTYNINFIEGRLYEDASFTWKYIAVAKKIYCMQEYLYVYYRHDNSIMNKTFAKANRSIDHMHVADNIYDFLVQHGLFENFLDEFFSFYKSCVYFANNYSDTEHLPEIEQLDAKLQEKFSPWLRVIEKKKKTREQQKVLASLRSKVKYR